MARYLITVLFVISMAVTGCSETKSEEVSEKVIEKNSIENLQKAIEMHKPQVLKIGDQEILYVPTSRMSGNSYSVDAKYYIYEEGKLKRIDLVDSK